MSVKLMNIYSPWIWHDDAKIVGNRDAIQALSDACDKALAGEFPVGFQHFDSNGEGMVTVVRVVSDEEMEKLPSHYTDSVAGGKDMGDT